MIILLFLFELLVNYLDTLPIFSQSPKNNFELFCLSGSILSVSAMKRNCIPLRHNDTYSDADCHDAANSHNPYVTHAVHSVYLPNGISQTGTLCVCHGELCNNAQRVKGHMETLWIILCMLRLLLLLFYDDGVLLNT